MEKRLSGGLPLGRAIAVRQGETKEGINCITPILVEASFWELVGDLFSICQRLAIMLFSSGNRLARTCGKPAANLPQLDANLLGKLFLPWKAFLKLRLGKMSDRILGLWAPG